MREDRQPFSEKESVLNMIDDLKSSKPHVICRVLLQHSLGGCFCLDFVESNFFKGP